MAFNKLLGRAVRRAVLAFVLGGIAIAVAGLLDRLTWPVTFALLGTAHLALAIDSGDPGAGNESWRERLLPLFSTPMLVFRAQLWIGLLLIAIATILGSPVR